MEDFNADKSWKVTMMLADAAQVADGKLNVLGAGWNLTGPAPAPFAIGLIFEVPWQETNRPHTYRFELVDIDGNPVIPLGGNPEQPLVLEEGFEVGRPPGVRPGAYLPVPRAINFSPIPLPPDSYFEWRLTIDSEQREDWRLGFSTRPA